MNNNLDNKFWYTLEEKAIRILQGKCPHNNIVSDGRYANTDFYRCETGNQRFYEKY